MANVKFSVASDLPAETVRAVATDFSEGRPRFWPNIDAKVYRVHRKAAHSAEVTEGSTVFGGIWAREAYDWSEPNTVRAIVQDSNAFRAGGIWELRTTPTPEGGCHIEVLNHRQAIGWRGRVIGAMLTLMGGRVLPRQLQQTLDIAAQEAARGSLPASVP
jgi:hypothetical protein